VGETPDPIPNSAAKPLRADGTAPLRCGRVGRRREVLQSAPIRRGVFFCPVPVPVPVPVPDGAGSRCGIREAKFEIADSTTCHFERGLGPSREICGDGEKSSASICVICAFLRGWVALTASLPRVVGRIRRRASIGNGNGDGNGVSTETGRMPPIPC
jgi:hypothetical protein